MTNEYITRAVMSDAEIERQYGRFVHMAPLDKVIWLEFLRQGGTKYAPFVYDLRVGEGVTMPPASSQLEIHLAAMLTTKRIDAVSVRDDAIRIFEAKPSASMSAVGQLLGYAVLYQQKYKPKTPLSLWLVTDKLRADILPVLRAHNINFQEVGE